MKSIFNIQQEYLDIISQIEDNEGELTPELEEALKINSKDLEHKVKAYHYIISVLKGEKEIITDEVERLNKLKETKQNTIDRLRQVLLDTTLLFGEDGKTGNKKLNFDTLKLWTVNKQVSVIDDNVQLEADYLKCNITNPLTVTEIKKIKELVPIIDVTYNPNKKKITEALKEGIEIKAARLETKPHIVIR